MLLEVPFFATLFGAILGPILLPFSGPKISIFFPKLAKSEKPKISEMQKNAFISFALPNPTKCQKGPQNGPKMVPKQFTYSLLTPYLLISNSNSNSNSSTQ